MKQNLFLIYNFTNVIFPSRHMIGQPAIQGIFILLQLGVYSSNGSYELLAILPHLFYFPLIGCSTFFEIQEDPQTTEQSSAGLKTWRSLLHPQQHGRIPGHIIVTSGHNPGKRQTRYALTCHSDIKLALGAIGFCDLAQCRSVKGGGRVDDLRGAHVLIKHQPLLSRQGPASKSVHSIALKATLVGHSFVLLENSRVLALAELNSLLQFKTGDDWLSLVKKLRPRP